VPGAGTPDGAADSVTVIDFDGICRDSVADGEEAIGGLSACIPARLLSDFAGGVTTSSFPEDDFDGIFRESPAQAIPVTLSRRTVAKSTPFMFIPPEFKAVIA
jgi:hypothetical protein